ncbi:hypothetical protein BGZ60DRAFT_519104 [Tricladium varicosporioides]|nr:hypothetical protein BGZ60DRAFT_519104 [Hymenoscyphus varicosporioides]
MWPAFPPTCAALVVILSLFSSAAASLDYCCLALSIALGPNKVFYDNNSEYQRSAVTYFAQQEGELTPSCYVKPASSQDVSSAIKTLRLLNLIDDACPFAVRGGGHHTVVGIANIDSGITIDLGNMNKTTLSSDNSLAYVGAGARWGSVYSTLATVGKGALGGRIADIGAGGFLTGGGISYFGAAYGFGCDMVANFEVVLSNGNIVNANPTRNPDLFAALKGGGNNLGIVTRFDIKTFPLAQYWGGNNFYLGNQSPALLEAFNAFTINPNFDNRSGIIITTIYTSKAGYITTVNFAYTEPVANPPVFSNFTNATIIPQILSDTRISTLPEFAVTLGVNSPDNLRQTSITATVKANEHLLQQIYLLWNATVPSVNSAQNLVYSLTFQPLPVSMLNTGPSTGGNMLGLDSSNGPLVVLTLTAQYTSSSSDAVITATTRALFAAIRDLAAQSNNLISWVYLNYADKEQDVINSYGVQNVAKLRAVARKFDPTGFFQKIQPGGYKLW